jgi:WD repeat-containing protein 24
VNPRLSYSHPDQRHNLHTRPRGPKLKRLGDPPTSPAVASQNMGTFALEGTASEIEAFVKLARGYVFGGLDRRAVCAANADVSSFSFPLLPFLHVELMVCLCLW